MADCAPRRVTELESADHEADVVIVGLGAAGACAALEATSMGASTLVLEGAGVVSDGDQEHPLQPGDVVLVTPGEVHQFKNTGQAPLKFLCLVPNDAASKKVTVAPECGVEED